MAISMGNSLCFCFLTNPQEAPKTKGAIPAQQLAEALDFWLPACAMESHGEIQEVS